MRFFFSDHFLVQRSEQRKISKKLTKSVYLDAKVRYFDTFTKHDVAIARKRHLGKLKLIMVAYDISAASFAVPDIYQEAPSSYSLK